MLATQCSRCLPGVSPGPWSGARLRLRRTDEGVRPYTCLALRLRDLERDAGAQLQFATWGHRHCDGAELGRVHKTVWRSQVHYVECVESFSAELEAGSFRQVEATDQCDIQRAQRRSIYGVASHVAKSVGGRRSEGGGIEPLVGCPRSRSKNGGAG